jgi:hypothetical protein
VFVLRSIALLPISETVEIASLRGRLVLLALKKGWRISYVRVFVMGFVVKRVFPREEK